MPAKPCRVTVIYPGKCCFGACLEPASHEVDVQAGPDSTIVHLRCPTHLEWTKHKQASELVRVRDLVDA